MNFEKPQIKTIAKETEEPVSTEKSSENIETLAPSEVSARLISVARVYGPNFWNELNNLNKDLENQFTKDYLLKNSVYHAFIGSTPWPGLELVEDDKVKQAVLEKIANLEEQVKNIDKKV
ncbi:hypothetical protein COT94_03660 [Candidatus Falkowbacteria bacterium CG10_big_fil_rev_8_21_14_0_10_37_14]|uniref:Uncharacterized protein n=1 Tax=Candidatus Falkowbacteria bacterium CG10_big_fil_rev_8_21_14_0_10_37_14 TaxID=1974561 RepID=A0A2M6WSP7_9BACT|nr:hypothetical protein [Candidatus Falkowbacteria bacterium]PIT95829.1 MAG: hypothetical protein COT94_03660 [Candidatus Falkowbacteria bacterium CG10_big_fil_rev_8_21_14_0_10_37_14]